MAFFSVDPALYRRYKDQILELSNSFQRDRNEHLPPGQRRPGLSDREIAEQLGLEERVVTENYDPVAWLVRKIAGKS